MVQLMLEGFGGDHRKRRRGAGAVRRPGDDYGIQCYHVNTRLSKRLEDIGELRGGKLLYLLIYCIQAVWCRFRYGVTNFYFIPAPGKKSALYRDWMVMLICRRFFKRVILHWHAAGLAKWLETTVNIGSRAMTYRSAGQVDLSIVLSRYNMADAEKLLPRQVRVVHNGIPDPCVNFTEMVLPRRQARFAARVKLIASEQLDPGDREKTGGDPELVRVLYVAHCMAEKGLFDAMQAVVHANRILAARRALLRLKLVVAGTFVNRDEKEEFDQQVTDRRIAEAVEYLGFVSGEEKDKAFREADLFCFPTYYLGENQPVNLIEAMAFGLPVVTTRWRSLPEMLPADYPGLVPIRAPEQIAEALLTLTTQESGEGLRRAFLDNFTLERHLDSLADAFASVEQGDPSFAPAAAVSAR